MKGSGSLPGRPGASLQHAVGATSSDHWEAGEPVRTLVRALITLPVTLGLSGCPTISCKLREGRDSDSRLDSDETQSPAGEGSQQTRSKAVYGRRARAL